MNFRTVIYTLFLLVVLVQSALAQSPKRIKSLLEKNKWEKALDLSLKKQEKDSLSPVSNYALAFLALNDSTFSLPIDSIYQLISHALFDLYRQIDEKNQKKHFKAGIDSSLLLYMRHDIESIAYDSTRLIDTEEAYIRFLSFYPFAEQKEKAIERRNQLAYDYALSINTPEAFQQFYNKYPDAEQVKNAKEFYESRLYEERTKADKLKNYQDFLAEYPNTPFRKDIERILFERMTAAGNKDDFLNFVKKYPNTDWQKTALLLYASFLESGEFNDFYESALLPVHVMDSLKTINAINQKYYLPIYQNQQFSLIDSENKPLQQLSLSSLIDDYSCGFITDDYLIEEDEKDNFSIVNLLGHAVIDEPISEIELLPYQFVKWKNDQETFIYHPAFGTLKPSGSDAKLLGHHFIALFNNQSWTLYSLSGLQLADQLRELAYSHHYIWSKKDSLWSVNSPEELARAADGEKVPFDFQYQNIEAFNDNFLLVEQKEKLGLIKKGNGLTIPIIYQDILEVGQYIMAERDSLTDFYTKEGSIILRDIVDYQFRNQHIGIFDGEKWAVWQPEQKSIPKFEWDSIAIVSPSLFVGKQNDSLFVFNAAKKKLLLEEEKSFRFHTSGNFTAAFLELSLPDGTKVIYNRHLDSIFSVQNSSFNLIDEDHLSISQKGKKGILNDLGQMVVPISLDAIANANDQKVATLSDGKFGLYDFEHKISINNEYSSSIERYVYHDSLYIAEKDGKKGIINHKNEVLLDFNYEDFLPINDSLSFAYQNRNWFIVNVFTLESNYPLKARTIEEIKSEHFRYFMGYGEDGYGVIDASGKNIIPFIYSEIVEMSSPDKLIFRAEKEIRELAYFIMVYYDTEGTLMYKSALEKEIQQQLYCE